MPVNFGKHISTKGSEKKIHPIEIYQDLDRSSEAGPLRPVQEEVLNNWFNSYRTKKDIILKLHTGQGKTLVGLLTLQSLLNQGKGPCLYLCPNIFLVKQTIEQARKFGIPVTFFGTDNSLPTNFLKSERILICNVQKLFNGYTKFGLNNESVDVGGIILDDSHACIDSIKEAYTIRISKEEPLYKQFLQLFEDDLKSQAKGTFSEILENEHSALLPVPYWSWIDKTDQITSLLAKHRDAESLKFQWPLIRNLLKECQCFISGLQVEISPYINPIHQFGSFNNAGQRILMSATTMNDSFFIKGLNISKEAIQNPLTIPNERWSGEKMIIIPYLIHESLNRVAIVNQFAKPAPNRNVGVVALVPSFAHSQIYKQQGCIIAFANTIDGEIQKFGEGHFSKPLVIVNRYDGIDLPDRICRVLIMDSKPYSENLADKYEEVAREDSNITKIKIAQKIEQGLGRSVRGEKDFSVIIITGGDLINFLRNPKTEKYFSPQTRKQIEIGYQIAELASEDVDPNTTNMMQIVNDLIRQSIALRDPEWKKFYEERMDKVDIASHNIDITEVLEIEKRAEELNIEGQHEQAANLIQKYINQTKPNPSEYGWYLQMMARFKYQDSVLESNELQTNAFRKNKALLKQREGYLYKKIALINTTRVEKVKKWINELGSHEKLVEKINEIYSLLSFEETSEHFESAVKELGAALGFESQRPDKEDREGPDNLWALAENDYLIIECKNEVISGRSEIVKNETGQMNNSCGWFKNNYPGANFKPIMIIGTKNVAKNAAFNFDVEILRREGLRTLKANLKSFYDELLKYELENLSSETIQKLLISYKLDNSSIKTIYTDKPYQL